MSRLVANETFDVPTLIFVMSITAAFCVKTLHFGTPLVGMVGFGLSAHTTISPLVLEFSTRHDNFDFENGTKFFILVRLVGLIRDILYKKKEA